MKDSGGAEEIPETIGLFNSHDIDEEGLERDGDIVLHPQPTKSPNDPLKMPHGSNG